MICTLAGGPALHSPRLRARLHLRCLQVALIALGPCKAPMVGYSARQGTSNYGSLALAQDLILGVPQVGGWDSRGLVSRGLRPGGCQVGW